MKKYNNYVGKDITFVVCAYKECAYLEESVRALVNQTVKTNIMISTSTPNEYIQNIADKFGIEVRVNPDGGQIKDYNFAMAQPDTPLVMFAHQDDILVDTFAERVIEALNYTKDPIISFTDYVEMHNDIVDEKPSAMVKIKRMLLIPAKWRWLSGTRVGKRMIQLLGDPITHPSVVCVKDKMPKEIFREAYRASMDWDLWERLSNVEGSFVYVPEVLLYHRMNDENQTVLLLNTTNERYENEYDIFCRLWPKPIAKFIMRFYGKAAKYY